MLPHPLKILLIWGSWESLLDSWNIWSGNGSPSFPFLHLSASRGAAEHRGDLLALPQDLLLQVHLSNEMLNVIDDKPFTHKCLRWCLKLYCLVLAGLGLFLSGVWVILQLPAFQLFNFSAFHSFNRFQVIFQLYVLSQTTNQELRQQRWIFKEKQARNHFPNMETDLLLV